METQNLASQIAVLEDSLIDLIGQQQEFKLLGYSIKRLDRQIRDARAQISNLESQTIHMEEVA